jgi:glutathione S-transferase
MVQRFRVGLRDEIQKGLRLQTVKRNNRRHTIISIHNCTSNLQIIMRPQLELYVLPRGIYPRRILLYLSEKGLESSPAIKTTPVTLTMEAPVKPPGSVHIHVLPDGTFIKQSVPILEYLEVLCDDPDPAQDWQIQLAQSALNKASMRGETSAEKASMREMLASADEASSYFGFACHKSAALFVPREQTSTLAAKLALESCQKVLKLLEENYFFAEHGELTCCTIAHCVLYSLLQFARELYGVDLLSGPQLPALRAFYDVFAKRDEAWRRGEERYPEEIRKLACQ